MQEEFVTFEIAKELKELGFEEACFGFYSENEKLIIDYAPKSDKTLLHAPLCQQVFKWFRNKHNILGEINYSQTNGKYIGKISIISVYNSSCFTTEFKTYEEAQLECLKKMIEKLKQNGR